MGFASSLLIRGNGQRTNDKGRSTWDFLSAPKEILGQSFFIPVTNSFCLTLFGRPHIVEALVNEAFNPNNRSGCDGFGGRKRNFIECRSCERPSGCCWG